MVCYRISIVQNHVIRSCTCPEGLPRVNYLKLVDMVQYMLHGLSSPDPPVIATVNRRCHSAVLCCWWLLWQRRVYLVVTITVSIVRSFRVCWWVGRQWGRQVVFTITIVVVACGACMHGWVGRQWRWQISVVRVFLRLGRSGCMCVLLLCRPLLLLHLGEKQCFLQRANHQHRQRIMQGRLNSIYHDIMSLMLHCVYSSAAAVSADMRATRSIHGDGLCSQGHLDLDSHCIMSFEHTVTHIKLSAFARLQHKPNYCGYNLHVKRHRDIPRSACLVSIH